MSGRRHRRSAHGRVLLSSTVVAAILLATAPAAANAITPPTLSVRAATLVAPFTGQQLYGISPNTQAAIASTTKLMTALVTLQRAQMGATFTYPTYYLSAQDSQIGLVPGERMTVHDLLVAMLLPSADDAAYDLAYNVGHGSVSRFIAMMNTNASKLGLSHTHYSTPIGFDTAGNYSSANDLVKLANYLLEHYRLFAQIVGTGNAVLRSGNQVRAVVNRDDLVARFPWIHGVKTGHTLAAGYVLVAAANRDGMTLLSAVLGTSSEAARDANTLSLLNWGYANFRLAKPVSAGAVLARPTVAYRPGVRADVIAAGSFSRVIQRSERLHVSVKVPRQLSGPIKRDARVGTATVLEGPRPIARIPLLLAHALPAVSPLAIAARFITRTSTLLLLVILLGGITVLTVRRRGQGRAQAETA